ncbi:hypothetical protein GCM10027176_52920 [Actinoallomurus bryophytorum]
MGRQVDRPADARDAAGSIAPLAAVRTTARAWTAPWASLLIPAVLCVLLVAGLVFRRRRRKTRLREEVHVPQDLAEDVSA